jgi:hypothetical protein
MIQLRLSIWWKSILELPCCPIEEFVTQGMQNLDRPIVNRAAKLTREKVPTF